MTGQDEEVLATGRLSRRSRWIYLTLAALAVGALAAGALSRYGRGRPKAAPTHPATTHASRAAPPSTVASAPVFLPPVRGLIGVGDVQLFARAAGAVVEIDFGTGTSRSRSLPELQLTGTVVFGATGSGAFVRPTSGAPGYFVPDTGTVRPLAGALANATVLPGPDPDHVWTIAYGADWSANLRLRRVLTGASTSLQLRVPAQVGVMPRPPAADGSGYVLATGTGGSFDVRPAGAHRLPVDLATSTVLAGGSDRLLVASCAPTAARACPATLLRLPDGDHRTSLGRLTAIADQPAGVIAPDGRTALIYQADAAGLPQARLLDLDTGRFRGGPIAVDAAVQPGALGYAPDGRWAFAVGAGGSLVAIDIRDGAAHRIQDGLPPLFQLAIRR